MARFSRLEERKERRRLTLSLAGSVLIILFIIFFGEKMLVNFSLFVDNIRGSTSPPPDDRPILIAPSLNPLPEATNSGLIAVTGNGTPGLTVVIYVNDVEKKRITITDNGSFDIPTVSLREGENVIQAQASAQDGSKSGLSDTQKITLKRTRPILEVTTPEPELTVNGDENTLTISGQTEEDVSVEVQDRPVLVRPDGTFSAQYDLTEGENIIRIRATDRAGNETVVERIVVYQR